MKICSNCKHYEGKECVVKAQKHTHPVTGTVYVTHTKAATWNRSVDGDCGPDAKLFSKGNPVSSILNKYDSVELGVFAAAAIVTAVVAYVAIEAILK